VHPKTAKLSSAAGKIRLTFTMIPPMSDRTGFSRNWIFASAHPFFCLLSASRNKFTARVHWIGWSVYLIAR
jgi:hypothetical protein